MDSKHQSCTDNSSLYDYAIALTGGIATGKSSAVEIFSELGYEIIDADKISHDILDEQHEEISRKFGNEYVINKRVLRPKLGRLVFANESLKELLEKLLHPFIRERIEQRAALLDSKKNIYLIDLPLFYETNRYNIDDVIVIYLPKELQIERLMHRDGFSLEEALARIELQLDIEEKKKRAKYVIDNSGSRDDLTESCKRIDEIIKRRSKRCR